MIETGQISKNKVASLPFSSARGDINGMNTRTFQWRTSKLSLSTGMMKNLCRCMKYLNKFFARRHFPEGASNNTWTPSSFLTGSLLLLLAIYSDLASSWPPPPPCLFCSALPPPLPWSYITLSTLVFQHQFPPVSLPLFPSSFFISLHSCLLPFSCRTRSFCQPSRPLLCPWSSPFHAVILWLRCLIGTGKKKSIQLFKTLTIVVSLVAPNQTTINVTLAKLLQSKRQLQSPLAFLLPTICINTLSLRRLDSAVCCCLGAKIHRQNSRYFQRLTSCSWLHLFLWTRDNKMLN